MYTMTSQIQIFIDDDLKEEIDLIKEKYNLTWEEYIRKSKKAIEKADI